jgi:trk system potassium uptake protein TrkH
MKLNSKVLVRITPSQTIMAGFALMILIGTLLLNLPIASKSGESIGFLNALFTATSANCVTGLVVVNTMNHWTLFGKVVILLLIQFGGLGFMVVITSTMLLLKRPITLRNRQAIQASFNQDSIGGMVALVRRIVLFTVVLEGAGAILLAIAFFLSGTMAAGESVYQGIFHAVSAFCNAGFDNIGTEGMIPYQSNVPVNFILMALIILGGIGFTVLSELEQSIKNPKGKSLRYRIMHLSLHSKIVLAVTAILLVGGTVLFLVLEWSNAATLGPLQPVQKIQAALFQSVTLRTAGFNTIPQDGMTEMSQAISCVLMLIGGSSASTAGGMKTVTIGVIVFSMLSVLKGRNKVEAFGRTLPLELLQKALTVVCTMLIVVFLSTFILYFTEHANSYSHTFLDLLFESSSAAGTVGVSTGITPHLSSAGKIVIIICMYLGRLSPVTVVVALNAKLHKHADGISYPHEKVIIG